MKPRRGQPVRVDRSAITLSALRYFVALADAGHFGRAASACHVSQSALSEQVAKLEAALGTPLFERARATRLTPAGRAACEHARRVLQEVDRLAESAEGAREPLSGELRLGAIPTAAPYLLPSLLPALRAAHPRLRLALRERLTAELLVDLVEHRLDAAIVALPVAVPGLVSRALYEEPFLVLLPRTHRLAARAAVPVTELAGERLLLLTEGHCLREHALQVCPDAERHDGPDLRATSLETLARLVSAGFGITLVPALAAPHASDLVTRPLAPAREAIGRTMGLVWRKSHPRPADMLGLCEILRATPVGVR